MLAVEHNQSCLLLHTNFVSFSSVPQHHHPPNSTNTVYTEIFLFKNRLQLTSLLSNRRTVPTEWTWIQNAPTNTTEELFPTKRFRIKEIGHLTTEERHLQRYADEAVKWYEYFNRTFQIFHEQLITTFHTNLQVCGTRLVSAYSHKIIVDTTHIQNKTQSSIHSKEATAAHEHSSDTRGWPSK